MVDYRERLARLQAKMQADGAGLAVFGATDTMRYLTGWMEHGHERLIGLFVPAQGDAAFVVPAMNARQAQTNPAQISNVIGWSDETGWTSPVETLLTEWNLHGKTFTVLIDEELLSGHLLKLQALEPQARFSSANETATALRQIKTDDEIAAMDAAGTLIDAVCEEIAVTLREGDSEEEIQERVHSLLKRHSTKASFIPLICFGENAAHPHHHPGAIRLKRGDIVIIDIGCLWDGYPSDITRTFAFGEPSDPDAKAVYEIVSRAHWAAREAAKPGTTGAEVDAAARKVITDAGYGDYFIHRTGHGIGLSTHEPPDIVASNTRPLEPGMCFSIEPGIYLPGRFGVRIENIVTLTQEGVVSLNAEAPRTLRIL